MKTRNAAYSALTALLLLLSNAFVTAASTASTTPKQTQSLVPFTDSSILANDAMPVGSGILAYGYQRVAQRRCQNATILASGRADNPITFVPELYPKSWTKCLCERIDLLQELCDDRHDRQRRTRWQSGIRPGSSSRSRWRC